MKDKLYIVDRNISHARSTVAQAKQIFADRFDVTSLKQINGLLTDTRIQDQSMFLIGKRELQFCIDEAMREKIQRSKQHKGGNGLGVNVAEFVHNLKNPLAILCAYIEAFEEETPGNQRIQKMYSSAERIRNLVDGLLLAIKQEATDDSKDFFEQVDVKAVIGEELEIIFADKQIKDKVKVLLEIGNLPPIFGAKLDFSQLVGNLIRNACDAMYNTERQVLKISCRVSQDSMILQVADSGQGIPNENLKHIFNPFFSTKEKEKSKKGPQGTGLGLSSCKKITEKYNGTIDVESVVGVGTTFKVVVPLKRRLAA